MFLVCLWYVTDFIPELIFTHLLRNHTWSVRREPGRGLAKYASSFYISSICSMVSFLHFFCVDLTHADVIVHRWFSSRSSKNLKYIVIPVSFHSNWSDYKKPLVFSSLAFLVLSDTLIAFCLCHYLYLTKPTTRRYATFSVTWEPRMIWLPQNTICGAHISSICNQHWCFDKVCNWTVSVQVCDWYRILLKCLCDRYLVHGKFILFRWVNRLSFSSKSLLVCHIPIYHGLPVVISRAS